MKFSVDPKVLNSALTKATKLVGMLESVVIVAKNSKTYLFAGTATVVQIYFESKVEKDGVAVVEFSILQGIIKTYKTELSFSLDDSLLYFKSKQQKDYKGSIVTMDSQGIPKLKIPEGGAELSRDAVTKLDSLVPIITVVDSKLKQEIPISFVIDKGSIEVGAASFVEAAYVSIKTKVKGDNVSFTLPAKTFGNIKAVANKNEYTVTFNNTSMYVSIPDSNITVKMPLFQSDITMENIKDAIKERVSNKTLASIVVDSTVMVNSLSSICSLATSETSYVDISVGRKGVKLSLHGDKGNLTQLVSGVEGTEIVPSKEVFMFYPTTLLNAFKRAKDNQTTLLFSQSSLIISSEIDNDEVSFLIMAVA